MKQQIIFDIKSETQVNDLILKLDYSEIEKDILLEYNCGDFLKGELFTIINSYINFLKTENIKYTFNLSDQNCSSLNYISRINFFKNIEFNYKENFNRHDSSKTLLEITEFNSENMFEIVTKVAYILKSNLHIEENTLNCINYCLAEIVTNVDMHSNSKTNGLIYVQTYKDKFIKIFIIDNGIGFYKSFEDNEEFSRLNEEELLIHSIKEGFRSSRSNGRGYGLFHTNEFIKAANGMFSINTYGKTLISTKNKTEVKDCNVFRGSVITLKVNIHNDIDFKKVFTTKGNYYTPSEFEEHLEYYKENGKMKIWKKEI